MTKSAARLSKLFEEESSDEFKQLLGSLPKDKSFAFNIYKYNGFWYASNQLKGVLNCESHFQAVDSDVLLVTTPKSGTTWIKALLFTLVNRPAKALQSLTTQSPHDLVPFLELGLYNYEGLDGAPDLSTIITSRPRLFATHMPVSALPSTVWDTAGCRIVYLCRDPRDIFISLWHFGKKVRDPKDGDLPIEEAFEIFCKGTISYGPCWEHVLGYWNKSIEMPSKILFLKYEDLKGDTHACLRRLADFLGLSFSENEEKQGVVDRIVELCSFDHLSNLEVNQSGIHVDTGIDKKAFFRSGQVGDSLNYLTPEMSHRLDNIVKDKLHASGFNYY